MATTVRVFVSATTADLGSVREDVAQALRKLNYQLEVEEDFGPEFRTVEQSLREKITSCQAVIHIVGLHYGGEPEPDTLPDGVARRSWTQREYDIARELGKPVYVFLCGDGFAFDKCEPETEELRQRQRAYRQSLIAMDFDSHIWEEVASREVLALRVREIRVEPDDKRKRKRKIAPSRILRHAPKVLFGREDWLADLDQTWSGGTDSGSINVCTLVAWGGVGKTSLVAHWVQQRFAAQDWPGIERYFDWPFYSQGTGESRQTSSDLFIGRALAFFGDKDPTLGGPWERGERLAQLVRKRRTLLVLDGIEPLQYPSTDPQAGMLKDDGLTALLQGLAADNPGLCVVTTRESLANLHIYNDSTCPERRLDELPCAAAVALLRHLQIDGSDKDLTDTWREAGGHALTLQLLGRYLADAHGGDIRKRDVVDLQEADRETQGRSAFKVMAAYERWLSGESSFAPRKHASEESSFRGAKDDNQRQLAILRLTGLFDRPITPDCLAALRADPPIPGLTDAITPLTDAQWNTALKRLESIDLIALTVPDRTMAFQGRRSDESTAGKGRATAGGSTALEGHRTVDAHPLIREYFAVQLRVHHAEAFQAAHGRLFDHLCESTEHRPDGLDGLQPLYQAVVHGCLAGRQQEACEKVYRDRILRGTGSDGFYSTKKLGAIGSDLSAVAAFFDQPWSRLSPNLSEADQAWLLNAAAFRLRALGRLTEALEPMRANLDMRVRNEEWEHAPSSASNLSELEVTLGRLEFAVADARRGIDFADEITDDWQMFVVTRTTAADALHQSGGADEARGLFADAERMQKKRQPQFDLLYSVQGFRYCDLLLAPAERAAWRALLQQRLATPSPPPRRPRVGGSMTGSDPSQSSPTPEEHSGVASPAFDSGSGAGEDSAVSAAVAAGHGSTDAGSAGGVSEAERTAALQACTEVERRARKLLEWRQPNDSVLDVALEDLTLARATLYASLLRAEADPAAFSLPPPLSAAVNGLRKAGQFDETPKGLLTSSVCHVLSGERETAIDELNEALQIARRGPMPLYHADVLLTRARLFAGLPTPARRASEGFDPDSDATSPDDQTGPNDAPSSSDQTNPSPARRASKDAYPWDSTPEADLAEARRLIEEHGYQRRLPELEDAEQALGIVSRDA